MYDQTAMHGEEGQLDEAVLYYYPENEFKGDMLDVSSRPVSSYVGL